jgi:hypothetical protein
LRRKWGVPSEGHRFRNIGALRTTNLVIGQTGGDEEAQKQEKGNIPHRTEVDPGQMSHKRVKEGLWRGRGEDRQYAGVSSAAVAEGWAF